MSRESINELEENVHDMIKRFNDLVVKLADLASKHNFEFEVKQDLSACYCWPKGVTSKVRRTVVKLFEELRTAQRYLAFDKRVLRQALKGEGYEGDSLTNLMNTFQPCTVKIECV